MRSREGAISIGWGGWLTFTSMVEVFGELVLQIVGRKQKADPGSRVTNGISHTEREIHWIWRISSGTAI